MKIQSMKAELKAQAAFIKEHRPKYKSAQSRLSHWENANPKCRDYGSTEYKQLQEKKWGKDRDEDLSLGWKVERQAAEYRELHIAYCMLRGTPYKAIEQKVRPGNEPNWKVIDKIIADAKEEVAREEALCNSAG